MTLHIGVDFHPHQQTIAWCDTATKEMGTIELEHYYRMATRESASQA